MIYICISCKKETTVKSKDAIQCTHCGFRILKKKRNPTEKEKSVVVLAR